jgi:4-hydroxythreonine-4-phosphate dehydrogenase
LAKKIVAISIGDLNGIGFEIALKSHEEIKRLCSPKYFISKKMATKCAKLLSLELPSDFEYVDAEDDFGIEAGKNTSEAGLASYNSFISALKYTAEKKTNALVTLPISKESWKMAGLKFVGHTDILRNFFGKDAIMALGCKQMMVALFTDHIPLSKVCENIKSQIIFDFLKLLKQSTKLQKVAVLGVNPHAGDGGALGYEDNEIAKAINEANKFFGEHIFEGPMVPDAIFNPINRNKYSWFVAMYHDQGLAPLKALHFEESINISLGLPIIRASVDHGTAFDIAYKNMNPSNLSYINAIKYAIDD